MIVLQNLEGQENHYILPERTKENIKGTHLHFSIDHSGTHAHALQVLSVCWFIFKDLQICSEWCQSFNLPMVDKSKHSIPNNKARETQNNNNNKN